MIADTASSLLQKLVAAWHSFTFARYFGASVIALIVDMLIYSGAILLSIIPSIASAIGYSIGIIVHWAMSSNLVFIGKKKQGAPLQWQRALFAGSALLGLGITIGTVQILTSADIGPIFAKLCAVIISFFTVYALRKWGVFR